MSGEPPEAQPDLEGSVAAVAADVLDVERLAADDDLFELGADSITMTQIVARMRAALGVDVTLAQVMENPSPRALTAVILAAAEGEEIAQEASGPPPPFPLSSRQTRVWMAEELHPRQPHQVALSHFEVTGELAPARLRDSMADVFGRHEILRTIYRDASEGPVQEVLSEGSYEVPLELHPEMEDDEATATVAAAVERGFDLAHELPLRALLIPTGARRWQLAVAGHNIAIDGWSEHLFLGDLVRAYGARAKDEKYQPAPARPYRDYVRWERGWLASQESETLRVKAQRALEGVEDANWRSPEANPEQADVIELGFEIPPAQVETIRGRMGQLGFDSSTAVGLAFYRAVIAISDSDDIAVGTVVDARGGRRFLDTLGSFTRIAPIRPRARSELRGGLEAFQEAAREAIEWSALPFEQLAAAASDSSSSPIFQACYVLQHSPVDGFSLGEAKARRLPPPPEDSAPFDLFLELVPRDRSMIGIATARAEVIGAETLQLFAETFRSELDRVSAELWNLA